MAKAKRKCNQLTLLGAFNPLTIVKGIGINFLSQQQILRKNLLCHNFKCYKEDEFFCSGIDITEQHLYDSPIYSCKFGQTHNTDTCLALAFEDGRIVIQKIKDNGASTILSERTAHQNAIFQVCWICHKRELISASADTTLCLWSLTPDGTLIPNVVFKGHEKSVKTVDSSTWDPAVFASGGRDCNIILWDTRCHPHQKSDEISGAHSSQRSLTSPNVCQSASLQLQNSIISVLFCHQYSLISCGASDGLLKIWDLRKTYSVGKRTALSLHSLEYVGTSSLQGFTSMCLSPFRERVYVTCLDGKIYSYHIVNPTKQPVAEYYGYRPKTYYTKACLSPCGSLLLSGSSDDRAYLWNTSCPGQPVSFLSGHLDEVTCVAWSPRNIGMVVTCSDDKYHRIFHLKNTEDQNNLRGYAQSFNLTFDGNCRSNVYLPTPVTSRTAPSILKSHSLPKATVLSSLTKSQGKNAKTQVTPRTSENKLLLSWLERTPSSSSSSKITPSSVKRKATFKRKLTDILDQNEENLKNENRKSAKSPTKDPLREANSQQATARELLYDNSNTKSKQDNSDVEDEDGFTFDKARETDITKNVSIFGGRRELVTSTEVTLLKNSVLFDSLSSPTANLPNFVIDGSSPHNRQELPVTAQKKSDWLSSFSSKKSSSGAPNVAGESTSARPRNLKFGVTRQKDKM